jgi:hypothetical protein
MIHLKTLVNLCFNLIWSIEMNQQQRAVVQQALEALKGLYAITEIAQEDIDCRFAWAEMPDAKEAITALRQLLEQPEPVQPAVPDFSLIFSGSAAAPEKT